MVKCGFSSFAGGECSSSADYAKEKCCVFIENCQRDVRGHLKSINVRDATIKTEGQLILARAGIKVEYVVKILDSLNTIKSTKTAYNDVWDIRPLSE